jgi:hypothetical protein
MFTRLCHSWVPVSLVKTKVATYNSPGIMLPINNTNVRIVMKNYKHATKNLSKPKWVPLCCCSCRWGETMSLNCGLQQAYSSPPPPPTVWSPGGMILTEEPKNSEKSLSQCHFVHHKPHMNWPGLGLHGERPEAKVPTYVDWVIIMVKWFKS